MNESSDHEDNPIEELHQHERMPTQTHTDRGRWGRVVRSFFLAPAPMKPSLSLVPWEGPAFSFEIVGYRVQGAGKAVLGDTSWSAQSSYYKPSFAVKKCFLVGKKPRLWYYSGGSSLICGNPCCRHKLVKGFCKIYMRFMRVLWRVYIVLATLLYNLLSGQRKVMKRHIQTLCVCCS